MCFICVGDVAWQELDWGDLGWALRPANVPESAHLCALDVRLAPGKGHDFHRHPNQEEIILVRSGTVEQWVRSERRLLTAGDMCFVERDAVHATFVDVDADEPARLFVVLGPSVGLDGYEVVDVSSEEPWASMRPPLPDGRGRGSATDADR